MEEHKDTITLKKDTLWKGVAGIFALLFVVSLFGGFGFGGSNTDGNVVNDGVDANTLSGIKKYVKYAGDLDLDVSDFEKCVNSDKYASDIASEIGYGASLGIAGTPGFLINGRLLSGAQPFSEFQRIIEEELSGAGEDAQRVSVDIGDSPVKGDPGAPVTIVEFSDYECPYCGRFYSQTLGQITSQYIDTGKVKFVYMDFPLSFHKNAQKAAEAARCAGEQGDYWGMHDLLFESGV